MEAPGRRGRERICAVARAGDGHWVLPGYQTVGGWEILASVKTLVETPRPDLLESRSLGWEPRKIRVG